MQPGSQSSSTAAIGVVLAGGRSTRFGSNKALAELDGFSLVRRAAMCLAEVCSTVVLADAGQGLLPEIESIDDGPGRGPAAGLLGASLRYPGRDLLVLACDLPAVPVALLEEVSAPSSADLIMARTSRGVEPLCALYRHPSLQRIAQRVANAEFALHSLITEAGLEASFVDAEDDLLLNVNRPADLERLIAKE